MALELVDSGKTAVDVIDFRDYGLGQEILDALRTARVKTKLILTFGPRGVEYMVSEVLKATTDGSMYALRIWSHGGPGSQSVSGGGRIADVQGVSWTNFDWLAPLLATLRPRFAKDGRLELRGCRVAEGSVGNSLMMNLARTLKVVVHAGERVQWGLAWVPPVWEADPYGFMRITAGNPVQ